MKTGQAALGRNVGVRCLPSVCVLPASNTAIPTLWLALAPKKGGGEKGEKEEEGKEVKKKLHNILSRK